MLPGPLLLSLPRLYSLRSLALSRRRLPGFSVSPAGPLSVKRKPPGGYHE
jgi:hypothetical protein